MLFKSLGLEDKENRELFISQGCAVENLQAAARQYGYDSRYEYKDGKIDVTFSKQPCEIPHLCQGLQQELGLVFCPSIVIRLGYGQEPKNFAPREKAKLEEVK